MRVQGLRVSKLIINMDAASDDKNRVVFAFLMYIVHLGWYDCVEYYFCMSKLNTADDLYRNECCQ